MECGCVPGHRIVEPQGACLDCGLTEEQADDLWPRVPPCRPLPLVVMPCSATKRPDAGGLPAIDRYDGPMWRTLRAALQDCPVTVRVWFLSAQFGFHPASMKIPDYERLLTKSRADDLLGNPMSNRGEFAAAVAHASRVLLVGGELYRETMRRMVNNRVVSITDGPGIGYQREQLRRWIAGLGDEG
jgi:hypothetical protein